MTNNLKIRVKTPEESERVQKALFKFGFSWYWDGKTVSHTDKQFLYAEHCSDLEDDYIFHGNYIFHGDEEDSFNKCPYLEWSVEKLEKLAESI